MLKWEPSAWADPDAGWRATLDHAAGLGSVVAGDWDGDGRLDVLVGDRGPRSTTGPSRSVLYEVEASTGRIRYRHELEGRIESTPQLLPAEAGGFRALYIGTTGIGPRSDRGHLSRVLGADHTLQPKLGGLEDAFSWPVFADVDGAPGSEVLFVKNREVWCHRADFTGEPLWSIEPGVVITSNPLISEQDGAGPPEICYGAQGVFQCLHTSVELEPDRRLAWEATVPANEAFFNQPVEIGDLDGDGRSELALGSTKSYLYIFSAADPDHILHTLEPPAAIQHGQIVLGHYIARPAAMPMAEPGRVHLVGATTGDGYTAGTSMPGRPSGAGRFWPPRRSWPPRVGSGSTRTATRSSSPPPMGSSICWSRRPTDRRSLASSGRTRRRASSSARRT